MKYSAAAGALGALVLASAAQASGPCYGANCYQRVTTPAVYGTFTRAVMVQPAQTSFERIPGQYATATEQVMVRPAQSVPHHIPAVTREVAEQVMVKPGGKVWSVTVDASGREIGCWVDTPPVYETRYRTVVVQPAMTTYSTIPAEYRAVQRTVEVSPPRLVARTSPAVYSTQTYQAQVAPATSSWQPIGAGAPVAHHTRRHPQMHGRMHGQMYGQSYGAAGAYRQAYGQPAVGVGVGVQRRHAVFAGAGMRQRAAVGPRVVAAPRPAHAQHRPGPARTHRH